MLNSVCRFPLGGFALYHYVDGGGRSGTVGIVPGVLWASLAVVALVWRLWPTSAEHAPGKGLRWMVLLCLALAAPVLLRKLMQYDGLSSMMDGVPTKALGLTIAVQFGVVATLEELYFRGCLFDAGRQTMGPVRAALLSSAVFVLAHVSQIAGLLREPTFGAAGHLLQVFALGCVLCLIYHRCGSLWPAIFYHGFLNASSPLAVWAGRVLGSGG
jgi:membrane protease YdiL (CAAX protease family)